MTPSRQSRIRGCLLGGAVGDALGAPVEFSSLDEIHERFGPRGIRDFSPAFGLTGAITDDTQMTLFTAEGLLRAENRYTLRGTCQMPSVVWKAYLRWLDTQGVDSDARLPSHEGSASGWLIQVPGLHAQRAPGITCLSALADGKPGTVDDPINESKGSGGVMRIAPVGILCRNPFEEGMRIAALTHGHPAGYLAAGFLAYMISRLIDGAPLRAAAETTLRALQERVDAIPNGDQAQKAAECVAAVESALELVFEKAPPGPKQIASLGEGWVAEEALAIALYCAIRGSSFEESIVLAVNHAGDSDSTGAITGNLLGAHLGEEAVPRHWLDQLELRTEITRIADDLEAHISGTFRGDVLAPELPDEELARYPGD